MNWPKVIHPAPKVPDHFCRGKFLEGVFKTHYFLTFQSQPLPSPLVTGKARAFQVKLLRMPNVARHHPHGAPSCVAWTMWMFFGHFLFRAHIFVTCCSAPLPSAPCFTNAWVLVLFSTIGLGGRSRTEAFLRSFAQSRKMSFICSKRVSSTRGSNAPLKLQMDTAWHVPLCCFAK